MCLWQTIKERSFFRYPLLKCDAFQTYVAPRAAATPCLWPWERGSGNKLDHVTYDDLEQAHSRFGTPALVWRSLVKRCAAATIYIYTSWSNIFFQESSSQSSAGELSSSQVELNHTSKPPSRQSSCLSLNSAKVHPEVMLEMKSPGTPAESATTADITGSDSADERRSHSGSVGGVLAAARSEGSRTETPTYRIYAISVRCTAVAI